MSQRSEKLRRRLERQNEELLYQSQRMADLAADMATLRQAQMDSDRFSSALRTVQSQMAAEEAKLRRGIAARAKAAERRAAAWQLTTWLAVAGLILAILLCATICAQAAVPAADTGDTGNGPSTVTAETVKEYSLSDALEPETVPEDYENEKIEAALLKYATDHGNVLPQSRVTWYTASAAECGNNLGITKSGFPVCEGVTIGVDDAVIPLMSDVCVEWPDGRREWYVATDTGVHGAAVDIYTECYDYAINCGVQTAAVYWVPQGAIC